MVTADGMSPLFPSPQKRVTVTQAKGKQFDGVIVLRRQRHDGSGSCRFLSGVTMLLHIEEANGSRGQTKGTCRDGCSAISLMSLVGGVPFVSLSRGCSGL
jgi:hypothetical protein